MKINSLIVLVATLGFAVPAHADDWDMTPTYAPAAQEMNQAQYQTPINPASLGGYSVSAPQSIIPSLTQNAYNTGGAPGSTGNTTALTNQLINKASVAGTKPNLPRAGTMGLAQVFGTSNDGLTSPGGYSPPMIWIPGVGSYRIPQTIGIPTIPGLNISAPGLQSIPTAPLIQGL